MMKNRWTDEQLEAINIENSNVIVSAGAGSGKTAVLSERVLRKVKDGISINKLLILTFTKAAAKEMKDRIRRKLKENSYLEQVKLIDSSYITTFDSYSLSIVKKYHTYLNVDKNIKITDSNLIDIRKKETLEKIMDCKYQEKKERFKNLIMHFALKDDTELKKMILSISNKLDLKYDKKEYLEKYEQNYYSKDKMDEVVSEYLDIIFSKQRNIKDLVQEISIYLEGDTLEKFYLQLDKITNARTYNTLKTNLENFTMPRKNKDYTEEAINLKDEIKLLITELKDLCSYDNVESIKNQLMTSLDDTLEIVDIILRLHNEFEIIKRKELLYDFNDISHLAIKLVKEYPEVRDEIKYGFQEILIDEYQDTSDTQEIFINEIANDNVYMVGDIKQSIYRFRNANPYIFKNKYDLYNIDTAKGKKIDLNKNFRSRQEVLSNINLIFNHIMDDEIGGANYVYDHQMIFGNMTYINEGNTNQNYNMKILTYEESDDYKNIVKEAFIIANDIKNRVENKYQVFDKDDKVLRDCTYSDFAILLDVKKNFGLYKQIFEYMSIPLLMYSDTDLVVSDDIYVLKNLIKFILHVYEKNYDEEFKYCFISLARSFLFNYDDAIIFEYFKDKNFKTSEIFKKAEQICSKIMYLPLEELFEQILTIYEYDDKLLTTTNILDKEKRIEYLTGLLSDLASMGYTIYDFSYYLQQVIDEGYSIKYKPFQTSVNSVKIMSIHTSKGLEFPVCYFANTQNHFNQMDLKEKITFDNKYGILLPEIDEESTSTIGMKLFRLKAKREDVSEKIRLLYVALTRAKEEIVIVAPENDKEVYLSDIVSNVKRDKYTSFYSIIQSIKPLLSQYKIKQENIKYTNDYLYQNSKDKLKINYQEKLDVKNINFNNKILESSHYSKTKIQIISEEEQKLMELGTKLHLVLEQMDFKNPDYRQLNINSFLKNKIEKFINSDIIQDNINCKMYKEYEFIFSINDEIKRGIIDLMIETDQEIIIVDYKLNNVIDDDYKIQLNGYKNYIMTLLSKPVEMYLYSIIGETFEKVY